MKPTKLQKQAMKEDKEYNASILLARQNKHYKTVEEIKLSNQWLEQYAQEVWY